MSVPGSDTKAGGQVSLITPAQGARLTVFQTWLCADDAVALLPDDGSPAVSVDHGYYLTGSQWDEPRLGQPVTGITRLGIVAPAASSQQDLELAVAELELVSETAIVETCANIPSLWGADLDFRVKVAGFVLARRHRVRGAVL